MKRQQGFSLIELLIVVAIILIIAAIAIPNMMKAKISANEASAVGSLRTIVVSEVAYVTAYPSHGYAQSLAILGPPPPATNATSANAGLLDSSLVSGQKSGYNFSLSTPTTAQPIPGFLTVALPMVLDSTGKRSFCAMEDGTLRVDANGGAIPDRSTCAALPAMPR